MGREKTLSPRGFRAERTPGAGRRDIATFPSNLRSSLDREEQRCEEFPMRGALA